MEDQAKHNRGLSEISHLFLSSVRERHTQGVPRPVRRPPGVAVSATGDCAEAPMSSAASEMSSMPSVDLTPEEFREVFAEPAGAMGHEEAAGAPPARVMICAHLGARQFDAVRRYARSVAAEGKRVGLVWVDVGEFRLSTFERCEGRPVRESATETTCFDARTMRDAINELNCDLDLWLIGCANPRLPEARALLAAARRWVLLTACDHDSIVAAYRSLKGAAELSATARLSLAAVDARSAGQADEVFRKLTGVCSQFIHRNIEGHESVAACPQASEFEVLNCKATGDKSQMASAGTHWPAVKELLDAAGEEEILSNDAVGIAANPLGQTAQQSMEIPAAVKDVEAPKDEARPVNQHFEAQVQPPVAPAMEENIDMRIPLGGVAAVSAAAQAGDVENAAQAAIEEVIDLPAGGASSVVEAVLKHSLAELVECPVRPAACPEARLAVGRDRRLVLVAVAQHGLTELRAIAQAYRWAAENRSLLAMAMPQFALDVHQMPVLKLLVDQADSTAEVLRPLFQVNTCSVQTYRRVRWGQRTGLLLNAA